MRHRVILDRGVQREASNLVIGDRCWHAVPSLIEIKRIRILPSDVF